jgi:transposase
VRLSRAPLRQRRGPAGAAGGVPHGSDRRAVGRARSVDPDSGAVRAAETVAAAQRGYDMGKRVNGTKRHIAVDVLGLLLAVLVTGAGVQDRDGALPLLERLRAACPRITLAWADGAYAGRLVSWAREELRLRLQIVKRPDDVAGFVVIPRRWVAERTPAWITGYAAACATTSGSTTATRRWCAGRWSWS